MIVGIYWEYHGISNRQYENVGFVCLKMEYAFKIAVAFNGKTDHQLYRFEGSLFSIPHVMTIDTVTTLVTLGLQGQNQNNIKSVGII